MRRDEVLRMLAEHRQEITAIGVKSLAVFGSVARDEAGPDCDVDILIEVNRPFGLFQLVRVQRRMEAVLGQNVDLATPDALRPSMRAQILNEAIRAA
jgi:uncharacterized protein